MAKTGSSTGAARTRAARRLGSARREAIEQAHWTRNGESGLGVQDSEIANREFRRARIPTPDLTLRAPTRWPAVRRGCAGAAAARLRRAACRAAALRGRAPPLRCMSTLPRKCAPSAIATRGETMSPSTEPLSRMSTLSLAVTLPVTSPSTMTDFANTCALMRAVRADRQDVLAQLNRAFDVTFDGQILAAVQLALDDDRFPDVHDVLLHVMARLGTRTRSPRREPARAAAAQPPVVRSPVGPLHHVSTCKSSACPLLGALGCLPCDCAGTVESRSQYMEPPERCLVLLLPRVSGNATMNDSPCVSTLTTTRRPRSRPRSSSAVAARHPRSVRQRVERPSLRPAGQGRARRRAIGGRGADRRAIRPRSSSRAAAPSPTTSRFAAPPRRSSRPAAVISIASAIEHEAVLNTLKALARRGWRTTLAAGRPVGHRRRPIALREAIDRRHGARVGDAREQRDRHDSADRRARRDRARARRAHAHRRRAVGRQDSRRRPRARRRSAVAVGAQVQRTEGRRRALDQARHAACSRS